MQNADHWVLGELADLGFEPYADVLPRISGNFQLLRTIETDFRAAIGNRLTKRQAVALGLLARSYQLSISCLVNQLQQNYAGWHCSYRSLMETFFVVDWLLQDPQRLEVYFENRAPSIGRIKTECCGRYPDFARKYDLASQVTHVENRALHLPRSSSVHTTEELPFSATEMGVAGPELAQMLIVLKQLQRLAASGLQVLLGERQALLAGGEVLWEKGVSKAKFGCLGYKPRAPEKPTEGS